ncbi:MAG: putative mycofactocin system creatinine amidohydrolase family protein MftE [Paracidovorax wautersii]|uniref:Putative mycofactocin system creatinine amidohydrolase family protein MftE n=1 Tax=Paracidovorax wautersii TaxID=1177982 RepID=A0A7V8JQW1_9BURK|nr:MAG: putative mycofactocin system creatinine amidohydrolase family protein MftE [Paracidovorax wautersii]
MSSPAPSSAAAFVPPSRYWAELTTRDFAALDPVRTVAVLPLGATEQHGPHLPLAVDACLADAMVGRALAQLAPDVPALVLPTQAVGYSPEHTAFPGTLSLSIDTVVRLWTDIGEGVARAGVKKLLLFNAHGGHVSVMDIVARELRVRCGLIVYGANWYTLPLGDAANGQFSAHEHRFGVHGGEVETSLMLAIRPQDVRMELAAHFESTSQGRAQRYPILGNGKSAKLGWAMQDYNPKGAAGHAALATAAKGEVLLEAVGRQLAALLAEIADLPLSTVRDDIDLQG